MGIFGRRRRERDDAMDGTPAGQPDAAVPFMSVDDAAQVRRLAQQAFAAAGTEVVVRPDHFAAANGAVFGLWNLAATCANAPGGQREWPSIVSAHVRAVLAPTPALDSLDVAELMAHVVLRVYGRDTIPDLGRFTYCRSVADDLIEALVFDMPESVAMLDDERVARLDLDEARAAGLEHLLREPVDRIESIQSRDLKVSFDVLLGGSVYTASRILAMTDLLRRVYGERDYPFGVLVTVAERHQVGLFAIDGPDALQAATAMARFAKLGYDDAPGGISPHLYWWYDGALIRMSRVGTDGRILIEPSPEFLRVLTPLLSDPE